MTANRPLERDVAEVLFSQLRNKPKRPKSQTLQPVKQHLEQRRRELSRQVRGRIRDASSGYRSVKRTVDEYVPDDTQDDLDPVLIEMKSELLSKVEAALRTIEEGEYGICMECRSNISDSRLIALPFALRCTVCQEKDENRKWHRHIPRSVHHDGHIE